MPYRMITSAKTILILSAVACLLGGCSTAFADFNTGAPQSDVYPDFANLPPPAETTALDPQWAEKTERVIDARKGLIQEAEAKFPNAAADPEAVAEEARRKTRPTSEKR